MSPQIRTSSPPSGPTSTSSSAAPTVASSSVALRLPGGRCLGRSQSRCPWALRTASGSSLASRALTPREVASPLASRPYDLRHAAASLWLNAGVPATQVAEWAGHSVNVLLRVYAKCVYGQEEAAKLRISHALSADDT
jgi:integrase